MSFSVNVLAGIAIELQSGIGHADRFQRLITTCVRCWSVTLQRCCATRRGNLSRWRLMAWPRMCWGGALRWKGTRGWRRLPAPGMWCVPCDSALPDPYDGLIPARRV